MQLFKHEQAFIQAFNGDDSQLKLLCPDTNFEERFGIYRTSIISTLQQVLMKNFYPLGSLIGDGAFKELTYQYALKNIPLTFNLSQYGKDLSHFVKSIKVFNHLEYLPDFIDFCYMWQQVFLYPNLGVITITSKYPLYQIWERCQPEYSGEKKIENWEGPFIYKIFRENDFVKVL